MTRLIPLLALTLCGCPEDKEDTGHWDPDAAICGRVIGGDSGCASSPMPQTVSVHTIAEGTTVCADYDEYWYDTGYQDWHDTFVDEAVVDADGYFSAHVDPGEYGLSTWVGPCEACEGVSVPYDLPTCTQVELVLSNPPEMDAPNIYLYPEVPTEVRVRLPGLARKITAVDPPYPQGWDVLAMPDGRLHTPWGERDYLFYELVRNKQRLPAAARTIEHLFSRRLAVREARSVAQTGAYLRALLQIRGLTSRHAGTTRPAARGSSAEASAAARA